MSITTSSPARPAPVSSADFDIRAAWQEGWTLSDCGALDDGSPQIQLQRLDALGSGVPIFAEDHHAWDHVVAQARTGSVLHRDALQRVDRVERALIEASCGTW